MAGTFNVGLAGETKYTQFKEIKKTEFTRILIFFSAKIALLGELGDRHCDSHLNVL